MRQELLTYLQQITSEEQAILDGHTNIQKDLYTSGKDFVIDSQKLLEKGRLIEIRPHTRFAHFPSSESDGEYDLDIDSQTQQYQYSESDYHGASVHEFIFFCNNTESK